jgi:hypothetical protein
MARRAGLQITPPQLLAAYTRCAKRTWPPSFDAAMADPLYSRLVHMNALGQLLADARTAKRAQLAADQALPWPARRAGSTARPVPHRLPTTPAPDRKRLAAGDTDDDE